MATVPASSQELALRMDDERRVVGETIDKLRGRLRREMDWRRRLAEHLGAAALAAAALGWVLGRGLRRLLG